MAFKPMSAADMAAALTAGIGENDEASTVTTFLDTGFPPLNYALSSRYDGGFPGGRIVEVAGPPSSGKTAILTMAMISAQKQGGIAGFSDHERSLDAALGQKLGLNLAGGRWVFKKPRTFEESIDLCLAAGHIIRLRGLIADTAPIIWGFDSLASMVPNSKLFDAKTGKDRETGTYTMHDSLALAKATSSAFPAFAQLCEELGICAVFLNQQRQKPGVVYGDPTTTPGGDAPKFYASIRMQLGGKKIQKGTGESAEITGMEIGCRVIKNKISRPFLKAKWRFMFNEDGSGRFDNVGSLIEFLVDNDVLEKSKGGKITWEGTDYFEGALINKINKDGSYPKLVSLMPTRKEPVIVMPAGLEGIGEPETAALAA